jgi:hypothetical protein
MSLRYPDISIEFEGKMFVVEKVYVSELNFVMIRLFNEDTRTYTTVNLGKYNTTDNFISNELRRHRETI